MISRVVLCLTCVAPTVAFAVSTTHVDLFKDAARVHLYTLGRHLRTPNNAKRYGRGAFGMTNIIGGEATSSSCVRSLNDYF